MNIVNIAKAVHVWLFNTLAQYVVWAKSCYIERESSFFISLFLSQEHVCWKALREQRHLSKQFYRQTLSVSMSSWIQRSEVPNR